MASAFRPNARHAFLQLIAAVASAFLCTAAAPGAAQSQPSAAEGETARALMHLPTTGLEVARAKAKLGQLVEARGLALEVASSTPTTGEPRVFGRARGAAGDLARELEAHISSLRTQVGPQTLDYSLTIDGVTLPREVRTTAYRTDPGPHIAVISAHGYASERRELTLTERQAATVRVTLTPAAGAVVAGPAPMPAPGTRGAAH